MLVVIIGILLWRVLPVFRRVLESLGVGASGSGSFLMSVGTYAGWAVLILIGLVVIAAIVVVILLKTKARGKTLQFLKNLFPPVKKLTEKLSASRVAGILGLMMSSGFPMEKALDMAPAALADEESILNYYRRAVRLRNENPELARGYVTIVDELTDGDTAVIYKAWNDGVIAVAYNTSKEPVTIDLSNASATDVTQNGGSGGTVPADASSMGLYGFLTVDPEESVSLEGGLLTIPSGAVAILR